MKIKLPFLLALLTYAISGFAQAPSVTYSSPQTYTIGTSITPLTPANSGGAVPATVYGQVSTFAGSGGKGSANGTGTAASFNQPTGLATDAQGNVYVADFSNNLVRKVTPAGVVSTLAGSGAQGSANGTGTAASFNGISGVASDTQGNVYVADSQNNLIRKITPAGVVTTLAGSGSPYFADGTGTAASFNDPTGVTTDAQGNIYVADAGNNRIRKITPSGLVSTLAGNGSSGSTNGSGTAASFQGPIAVTADGQGNIYVSDSNNSLVRMISPTGVVTTLAGSGTRQSVNGTGTGASFSFPLGISTDGQGNVYVAEYYNNFIRKITSAGVVTTLAGSGARGSANGIGSAATFTNPDGVASDAQGNVYVSDETTNLIRKITITGYTISSALPTGLTFDATTGTISGTPTAGSPATNYTITAYNASGTSSAVVNIAVVLPPNITYSSPQTYASGTAITPLTPSNSGGAVPATVYGQVSTYAGSGAQGSANGSGTAASFYGPQGVATDTQGNVYVADGFNNVIRKITPTGVVTNFAGSGSLGSDNGPATTATFSSTLGVTTDNQGNFYVSDGSNLIRKINPSGIVSTLAGNGTHFLTNGTGTAASFNNPTSVTTDGQGNIYVADRGDNVIRKITPNGVVTTLAGSGSSGSANGTGAAASFNSPIAVAADSQGNIYVADVGNNLIRKITPAGVVSTLAGTGSAGSADGLTAVASFNKPIGVATDSQGNVYVGDDGNNLVRKITTVGVVTTIAGSGAQGAANGTGNKASFNGPSALAADVQGNIFVADFGNNLIRKIIVTGYSINPSLPTGLNFDATTGTISGTPTAGSAATNYTITAYNTGGSSSAVVSIAVNALPPPSITYTSPQAYNTGTAITPLTLANSGGAVPATVYGQVSTFAGNGTNGRANGTGTAASFMGPSGLATDALGNIYVADQIGNQIRKITPAGVVSTFAGSGSQGSANGTGTVASFNGPAAVATDAQGNVYVAEEHSFLIRKITPAGVVSTLAGSGVLGSANGTGTAASFSAPTGVATDAQGNVYVGDTGNHLIRKITPAGVVSTFAGSGGPGSANGTGTAASFNEPGGIATDAQGNIYVADGANQLIRKITPAGVVSTLAGSGAQGSANGTGTAASFHYPGTVTTDAQGNVYVADSGNNLIREITPAGVVTTLAGNVQYGSANGTGTAATFDHPGGVATDGQGNLYVADTYTNLIRKIIITGYTISSALPAGLTFDVTTGTISGTPTVGSPATDYTTTAYNAGGSSNAVVNIAVNQAYYSKASGSLSSLSTYGILPDGTGTAPTDFNGSGMGTSTVYQLANRGSYALTANLSVGTTLNIPSGASLDISSYALTLNNLAGAGTLSGSAASALTVNGTGVNLAFNTNANQLGSLTLGSNASVTLTSALSIAGTGTLNLPANGTLNTGGFLTLKSGTAGTAAVTALGSGSSVNGDVVAERYVSDKRAWRLISPPVNSYLTINGNWQEGAGGTLNNPSPGFGTFVIGSSLSNGFDVNSTSTSSLMVYTGGALSGIANTNYTALNAYAGYFMFIIGNRGLNPASTQVHSSTVLRSTGALRTGAQTVNLGGTALTLAGNPYASPVDFANVTRSTGVANQFYAWDYNLNTYGGYVLVTNIAGNYTSVPASPSGLNNILQSGQAFFVYNNSPNAGTLTFNESSKATGNGLGTFGAPVAGGSNNNNSLRINLLAAAASGTPNAVIDGVMAGYGPAYSNQVDADDAVKMTNLYENIALQRDKQLLTLERRQDITVKDTLFIQLSGMKAQGYQLQVDPAAFSAPVGTTAYLEDAYLHTRTKLDLTQLTVGAFNIVAGSAASYQDRFMVTFANDSQLTTTANITGNKVAIYPNPIDQKRVSMYFNAVPVGVYTVTLVNAMGQVMQKKDIAYTGNNYNQLMDASYSSGVYIINIRSAGFNQTEKIIIP